MSGSDKTPEKFKAWMANLESGINRVATPTALTGLVLYCLPLLLAWENAYIIIHDNLDAEYALLKSLADSGKLLVLGDPLVTSVFEGLPRSLFRSPFDFTALLFGVFDAHAAYIINFVIAHGVGFAGMFFLLTRHVLVRQEQRYLAAGVSLLFAVVPFYAILGASISAQPLLLYGFLNIRKRIYLGRSFAIVVLFPLFTSLFFVAPFVLSGLGVLLLYDVARSRKLDYVYIAALALLTGLFVAVDYHLFSTFFSDMVSHRSAWSPDRFGHLQVADSLERSVSLFLRGQYHAGKLWTGWLIAAFVGALALKIRRRAPLSTMLIPMGAIVAICLFYGFYTFVVQALADVFPILVSFQAHRFYVLLPFLWMVLFAISLAELRRIPMLRPVVLLLLGIQLAYLTVWPGSGNLEFRNNLKLVAGLPLSEPTNKEFFAPELFERIETYIGRPQSSYRVLSLAMPPSVALFNGFSTLDSYQPNYPHSYKLRFRKIIENELAKDETIRRYYDEWGSRVYLFSAELGRRWLDDGSGSVRDLDLNTDTIKEMGGEYIFSAVPIENAAENSLELQETFIDPESYWTVRLYKLR